MTLPSVDSVAPCEPERLLPFFAVFLLRAAAAAVAETMQLELVAAARAAIAKRENFMVVVVEWSFGSARVLILCLLPIFSCVKVKLYVNYIFFYGFLLLSGRTLISPTLFMWVPSPPTRTVCVRGCFVLFCFCFFVDPIFFLVSSFWSERGRGCGSASMRRRGGGRDLRPRL